MSLSHFPKGVSSFGIPVMGSGSSIPVTTGKYFYVDSNLGNAGNTGLEPTAALATIAQAITKCTTSKGDVIIVMPGHAETVATATAFNLNKIGVSIVGLGQGTLRPTISLSLAAATLTISAASCSMKNLIVKSTVADVLIAITITGANCTIDSVEFPEPTADENIYTCISTTGNYTTINACKRYSIDANVKAMISVLGSVTGLTVANCLDQHTYGANIGQFMILGANDCINTLIIGNILHVSGDNSAQSVGNLITGSSTASNGTVAYNLIGGVDVTGLVDTATLEFSHFENYLCGIAAKSGLILPAIS